MNYIQVLVDLFLHLDINLGAVISSYGLWTYLILFALVFCETGLVVTPFLPGDSLLFVAGAFAASGSFNLFLLFSILGAAAILGDTVNYQIGHWLVDSTAIITYFKEKGPCNLNSRLYIVKPKRVKTTYQL